MSELLEDQQTETAEVSDGEIVSDEPTETDGDMPAGEQAADPNAGGQVD
jgi:hypothetical protein